MIYVLKSIWLLVCLPYFPGICFDQIPVNLAHILQCYFAGIWNNQCQRYNRDDFELGNDLNPLTANK